MLHKAPIFVSAGQVSARDHNVHLTYSSLHLASAAVDLKMHLPRTPCDILHPSPRFACVLTCNAHACRSCGAPSASLVLPWPSRTTRTRPIPSWWCSGSSSAGQRRGWIAPYRYSCHIGYVMLCYVMLCTIRYFVSSCVG
jgi:hypothetical protein